MEKGNYTTEMFDKMFGTINSVTSYWLDMWRQISKEIIDVMEPFLRREEAKPLGTGWTYEEAIGSWFAASSWIFRRDILEGLINAARFYISLTRFWLDAVRLLNISTVTSDYHPLTENWRRFVSVLFKEVIAQSLMPPLREMIEVALPSEEEIKEPTADMFAFLNKMSKLWFETNEKLLESISMVLLGREGKWKEVYDSWRKAYDETVGKLLNIPQVGPVRVPVETYMHMLDSAFRFFGAFSEYYLMLQTRWLEAMEEVAEKMPQIIEEGKGLETFRNFYELVIRVSERHYHELFKSASFREMLSVVLKRMSTFLKNRQKFMDWIFENQSMPTRSEIDELHKEVFVLKQRINELMGRKAGDGK